MEKSEKRQPKVVEPKHPVPEPYDQHKPTNEDVAWWNNSQNRNYMAGDGPHAGQTEVDGGHQSASTMDADHRAKTLAKSKKEAEDRAAAAAVGGQTVDRDEDASGEGK